MAGEPAAFFYIVASGWVKLYRETIEGVEAVIDVVTTGAFFGEGALFDGGRYPHTAEIVESSRILSVPLHIVREQIDRSPDFARAMLHVIAQQRDLKEHEIEHLSTQNASQRIGCFLLRLAGYSATSRVAVDLPYDKTLIAARLGMQPETFSRALGKLKTEAGVHIKGAKVEIDEVEKLSSYVCVACSSEFPCRDLKNKT